MVTVEASVVIKAEPKAVFKRLLDLDSHLLWNSGLLEIKPKHATLRPGLIYTTVNSQVGRKFEATNEVMTVIPNQQIELVNASRPLRYHILYLLDPSVEGSELTCRCEVDSNSNLFELAEPLVEALAKAKVKGDLESLKTVIEHAS